MSDDLEQFYEIFFEESSELLADMEACLLRLNVSSPDLEDLNAIFRAAHSIKGGAGTFGFTDITETTHMLESLLDKLRKGELEVRSEMIDAFLKAGDVIKNQLAGHRGEGAADPAEAAMAWALQYKEKQIALQQLEVAKPKAEFVDKYVERGSLKILTDVAKELGVSGKTLGKWLREEGWAWKDTTKLRWTQEFIDKGYGETKHFTSPGGFDGSQAYVTAAGDLFIKQNFKQSK